MSKKLTLEQSGWNCGAIELHEGPLFTPAAFMDGARNQFLARTGLTKKQHRRVAGSHSFHQFQNMAESRTLPHNSFEVHVAAEFVFQIQLFLRELVFEIGDFTVRQGVFHADRDLPCDLRKKRRLFPLESIFFPARQDEHAEYTTPANKRHVAKRIHTLPRRLGVDLSRHFGGIKPVQNPRLAAAKGFTGHRTLNWNQSLFLEKSFAICEVESMHSYMRAVWLGQHDRCGVAPHDLANARRDRPQ